MRAAKVVLSLGAMLLVAPRRAAAQEVACDVPNAGPEVRSLKFEGNVTFSDDQLSTLVVTTPSSLSRRLFKIFGARRCYPYPDGLRPDVDVLKLFYRYNGFYQTTVDTVVTPRGPKAVDVAFVIHEGEPLRVDSMSITGLDSVPQRDQVTRGLRLAVGSRFGLTALNADMDSIVARLRNLGYAQAAVFPATRPNPTVFLAREVDLDVIPGPRVRFGPIQITSLGPRERPPAIDSALVRTLLGFESGDWFSDRAIADAQRNLYQLGTYLHVGITLDTTAIQSRRVVGTIVDLREDYMRQFDLEEGWATLDCFRVNAVYTEKNFLDRAIHLDVTGRMSKIGYADPTTPKVRNLCYRPTLDQDTASTKLNYFLGTTLRNPTLFNTRWVPALSTYTERRGEYKAWLRTTYAGADASVTRNVAFNTPVRLGYTAEIGQTSAEPAQLCVAFGRCTPDEQADIARKLPFAVASASIQQNRTDNVVEPTHGYVWASELRGASQYFGAHPSLTFIKGTGDFAWFTPVRGRSAVFMARLRGGLIGGGFTGGSGVKLPPPQERLYAGGPSSVRGFGQNELGRVIYLLDLNSVTFDSAVKDNETVFHFVSRPDARAVRSVPVGGNSLLVANAELRVRDPFFPERLEYVFFADAGDVWTRQAGAQHLGFERLYVTPGIGFRIFTPVGPIQLNAGYNGYGNRAGQAVFPIPSDLALSGGKSPLVCVTPPGSPTVDVPRINGVLQSSSTTDCPAAFSPFQSPNFLKHFNITVSVGTGF